MAGLKKGTPGGEERRHVHFRYVSTEAGKSWHAYLAGPPLWYLCHTHGKSKPCLKWLTDNRVPCARCASLKPPELIGYVPLYRESDGAPVMVIVYERSADVLAGLMHLSRVTVMREGEKGDTVVVVKALTQKAYSSMLKERSVPVDLEPCLVRMWNVAELTDWYKLVGGAIPQSHASVKVNALSVPTEPSEGVPLDTNRVASYLDAAAEQLSEAEQRARRNAEFLRTKGGSKSNGHHKKEGE